MEFVAIIAGVLVFCCLYPIAGAYKKHEASKELRKRLKAMNFTTTASLLAPAAEIYIDADHGSWFVCTDLETSFVEVRPARELAGFELRESGNLILSATAGKPFSTALFSDSHKNVRLPENGKCTEFYLTLRTRGASERLFTVSLLDSTVFRSSPDYKNALARARHAVRALAELCGSKINETNS